MKKIFLALFALSYSFTDAQVHQTGNINNVLGVSYREGRVQSGTEGKSILYDEIQGSPYADKTFKEAKIAENYDNAFVRYNSFKDEIEYIDGENIKVVPKDEAFHRVEILFTKEVLVYTNLGDEANGYYFEVVGGNTLLFKKVETKYIESKKASNSYGNDKPATFRTSPEVYYIKTNGKILKDPKKEKQIIEMFPDKKEALNTFFKQNKINFNKEVDLVRLVKFLNQ